VDPEQYVQLINFSGCGHTVNANHPVVKQLIIDSLVGSRSRVAAARLGWQRVCRALPSRPLSATLTGPSRTPTLSPLTPTPRAGALV
jgi:hypothetical protein